MSPRSAASHQRREREREETREKILDAARHLFASEGYEAVTMRGIADHISYTAAAIYHHFDNKQALCTELCICDFQRLGERFRQIGTISDPIERLRAIGSAYVDFARDNPNHYRYMFMTVLPPIDPSEVHAAKLGNPEHDAYALLRQTCQEAIDQGRLQPEYADADEVAQVFWAALHGLISLQMVKGPDTQGKHINIGVPWRDVSTTASHMIDVVIRGTLRETGR